MPWITLLTSRDKKSNACRGYAWICADAINELDIFCSCYAVILAVSQT